MLELEMKSQETGHQGYNEYIFHMAFSRMQFTQHVLKQLFAMQMYHAFIKPVMVTTNFSVTDYAELLQNMKIAFNIIRTFKADNISAKTS